MFIKQLNQQIIQLTQWGRTTDLLIHLIDGKLDFDCFLIILHFVFHLAPYIYPVWIYKINIWIGHARWHQIHLLYTCNFYKCSKKCIYLNWPSSKHIKWYYLHHNAVKRAYTEHHRNLKNVSYTCIQGFAFSMLIYI